MTVRLIYILHYSSQYRCVTMLAMQRVVLGQSLQNGEVGDDTECPSLKKNHYCFNILDLDVGPFIVYHG